MSRCPKQCGSETAGKKCPGMTHCSLHLLHTKICGPWAHLISLNSIFPCFSKIVSSSSPWLHSRFSLVLLCSLYGFVAVQKAEPLWGWKDRQLSSKPLGPSSLLDLELWTEFMNNDCIYFYLSETRISAFLCGVLGSLSVFMCIYHNHCMHCIGINVTLPIL